MKNIFDDSQLDEQSKYWWLYCKHYEHHCCKGHDRVGHRKCLNCKDFKYDNGKDNDDTVFIQVE